MSVLASKATIAAAFLRSSRRICRRPSCCRSSTPVGERRSSSSSFSSLASSSRCPLPIATVDAFSTGPYSGNPAAVVLLPPAAKSINGKDTRHEFDAWMGAVANEMNLSETAFVRPMSQEINEKSQMANFELRWWTPNMEVDLCGHATMATSHALYSEFGAANPNKPITFHTRSGPLVVQRESGHEGSDSIRMDFPNELGDVQVDLAHPDVETAAAALGVPLSHIVHAQRNRMDLMVVLQDEASLNSVPLTPDFGAIATIPDNRVLIVTAQAEEGEEHDVAARFFAPAYAVDEDPVCGSAHCFLGPYWAKILGKSVLKSRAACQRGGAVTVGVGLDGGAQDNTRVVLQGSTITTVAGQLSGGLPDALYQ